MAPHPRPMPSLVEAWQENAVAEHVNRQFGHSHVLLSFFETWRVERTWMPHVGRVKEHCRTHWSASAVNRKHRRLPIQFAQAGRNSTVAWPWPRAGIIFAAPSVSVRCVYKNDGRTNARCCHLGCACCCLSESMGKHAAVGHDVPVQTSAHAQSMPNGMLKGIGTTAGSGTRCPAFVQRGTPNASAMSVKTRKDLQVCPLPSADRMMQATVWTKGATHNEVIIDASTEYEQRLPHGILAFFHLAARTRTDHAHYEDTPPDVHLASRRHAARARQAFVSNFSLHASSIPILEIDLSEECWGSFARLANSSE